MGRKLQLAPPEKGTIEASKAPIVQGASCRRGTAGAAGRQADRLAHCRLRLRVGASFFRTNASGEPDSATRSAAVALHAIRMPPSAR